MISQPKPVSGIPLHIHDTFAKKFVESQCTIHEFLGHYELRAVHTIFVAQIQKDCLLQYTSYFRGRDLETQEDLCLHFFHFSDADRKIVTSHSHNKTTPKV